MLGEALNYIGLLEIPVTDHLTWEYHGINRNAWGSFPYTKNVPMEPSFEFY